ncbi:sensor histidine kinase [Streptomyces sp. HNM0645]|uniref:sensor histidine kinase n=1 Tax=Streptomyces sp. HNM0645 TaxID=2782343 RepID=UPI0024B7448E|nr:sensor histidine kinase [Streptomyces sp. HNM0645]MDI9885860.1 sensor histidine kinase [Streptomyces sp. HNM0645]
MTTTPPAAENGGPQPGPARASRPRTLLRDAARSAAARHVRSAARESLRTVGTALTTPAPSSGLPPPGTSSRFRQWLPHVLGVAAVSSLLPVTINVLAQDYRLGGAVAGALATAQTAPLLLAVTRPLQAWWIVLAADVLGAIVLLGADGTEGRSWPWPPMTVVGYLLLMLCLGLRERRRTLVAVWLVTGAAGFLFELVSQRLSDGVHVLLFVLGGIVLLVADTLRTRGEVQRRLAEQETISEAERARRTLLEERARIARELHDVVAHHMSVITVQADSAPYRIGGLPGAAQEEFATIAAGARESLTEMRRLLAVLRSEGSEGERAPQPGLGRLQQLVEATVRAGVPAELSLPADLGDVPQALDLSAYRIVQEALANVVRHAPGAATRVSVGADGAHLTVLVVNGPAAEPVSPLETSGTGHGLVGMRERVRLTGGTLDTGPLPDGGFRVAARMPLAPASPPGTTGTGDTTGTGGTTEKESR